MKLFNCGSLFVDPEVFDLVTEPEINVLIDFHSNGLFNEISEGDKLRNHLALRSHGKIRSVYSLAKDKKVLITTDIEESYTVVRAIKSVRNVIN